MHSTLEALYEVMNININRPIKFDIADHDRTCEELPYYLDSETPTPRRRVHALYRRDQATGMAGKLDFIIPFFL